MEEEVLPEALSSARDGPAGKITKCMLDSMKEDSLCGDNTPEGDTNEPENPQETDVTISNDVIPEPSEEVLLSARDGPAGQIAKLMLVERTRLSAETYVIETELNTDTDLSRLMTPTPTSTEVGEALVSEVMDKVKADLQAASFRGNREDLAELSGSVGSEDNFVGRALGDFSIGQSNETGEGEEIVTEVVEEVVELNENIMEPSFIEVDRVEATEEIVEELRMMDQEIYRSINVENIIEKVDVDGDGDIQPRTSIAGTIDIEIENSPSVTNGNEIPDEPTVEDGAVPSELRLSDNEDGDDVEMPDKVVKRDFLDASAECENEEVAEEKEMEEEATEVQEEEEREERVMEELLPVIEQSDVEQEAVPDILVPPVNLEKAEEAAEEVTDLEQTIEQINRPGRRLSVAAEDTVKVAMLEETVAALRKSLEESEEKITSKEEEIKSKSDELESAKTNMEDKFKRYEIQLSEVMGQLRQLKDTSLVKRSCEDDTEIKVKLETDIKTYRDQIKQDAVAICALEGRLDKVVKKNKEYQVEVKELAKTVQDLKTERQALVLRIQQLESSRPQSINEPPPMPKVLIQRPINSDMMSVEILRLRQENSQLKTEVAEHQHCVEGLRRDLAGADARLSDMAGELSESQKEALEAANAKATEKEAELSQVKGQMKALGDLVEKYKVEIINLKDSFKDQKSLVDEFRGTVSDQNIQIKNLQNQLMADAKRNKENANQQESKNPQQKKSASNDGHIAQDLTALGSRCKGERHDETIFHQREALAELRSRLKALEQIKPSPSSNQDQALSQIFMLKRELAEMRAKQASQTLDQRHHIIRKIQTQVTEGHEDVTGSSEGQGRGIRSPSPSVGLPSINKSLESKQRLTAMLKDPKNTRPRIVQNGGEYSLEEKPRSPRSAWLEGSNSTDDNPGRGTPSLETDINFAIFRQPAPPGGPRNSARSSSRSRPMSATVMQERGTEDAIIGRESYEALTSKRHQAEAELEKSAHNETSRALDLSEEIYLQTVKTLASQLSLPDIPGVHTIAHLPQDERATVGAKRLEALQILSTRVAALKERIERKDQLLQGYETDLEKLRQAERSNKEWSAKVENLSAELRTKTEEGHYLRESLSRTREKLDQENRLNSAIKLKKDTDGMFASMLPTWVLTQVCLTCRYTLQNNDKTFHLENEFNHKNPTKSRPSSATDDKKKKDQSEILKKKNYEMKRLKTTLDEKERELYDVKRRYAILQDMQKNIHVESPGYSSRRSSAGRSRPPAVQSKQSKRQSQSSISFQEGIVEIPLESESMLVSQSEEPTTTADQSEPLTAESQSEFTVDVVNDPSEDRNETIDQSEAANDDISNQDDVIADDAPNEMELTL